MSFGDSSLCATTATFTGPGTAVVRLTCTTADNCTATDDLNLKINPNPTLALAPTNATCQGTTGSITVTITGGESPYTCSTDGGAFSVCASGDVIPNLGAGSHSITVKDANTCQDTASATIGQQSCGKIAPTNTTCSQFTGGTAGDITQLCFGLKQGKINNVAPGVFFYFSKITSDVSGNLTIDIVQTNSPSFPYFEVQQNSQVTLYNASCGNLLNPAAITINNGQVHIVVSNVTIGQVIIVQVKYSANSIVGTSANKNTAIHYGFATNVNGVQKDADPDGLNLINCVGGSTSSRTGRRPTRSQRPCEWPTPSLAWVSEWTSACTIWLAVGSRLS